MLLIAPESFIKTAYEAVLRAVREVLKFIVEAFKRLWKFMSANAQRTAAVDDLRPKLQDLQHYIEEVDRCMAGSSLLSDYTRNRASIFSNSRHNMSKSWNSFRSFVIFDRDNAFALAQTLAGALKVGVAPFVEAVDEFLTELSKAVTDSEIQAAVAKMSLFSTTSGPLVAMAAHYGYSPSKIARAPSVTSFQSLALWFRDMFRSWGNERVELTAEEFDKAILQTDVQTWAGIINDTIKSGSHRSNQLVDRINAFNEKSLKPGLEDAYTRDLAPFFKSLLSITQGFSTLEGCLSTLTSHRDNATIAIAQAALGIVKTTDAYVKKHQDDLTVGARSTINLRRKQLAASIGQ